MTPRYLVAKSIEMEMNRTDENMENPDEFDYISDLVRHLNNLLPEEKRYFPGDW